MEKEIEPRLKTIGTYLQLTPGKKFIVPDFQRAYEWDSYDYNQCDKLLNNIRSYMEFGIQEPYFFGTIITNCSENDRYCLVDGQQRTTTFLLLAKALQLHLQKLYNDIQYDPESRGIFESVSVSLKKIIKILYLVDDEQVPDLMTNPRNYSSDIFVTESMNEMYSNEMGRILNGLDFESIMAVVETIPHRRKDNRYTNFARNFKYFYQYLEKLSQIELKEFAKTFLDKCQVIDIRSWNLGQATAMFNSLNSTGLPLYDSDIISSEMYAKASDRTAFKQAWQNLRQKVGELEIDKIVDMDKILTQLMYINRAKSGEYMYGTGGADVTVPGMKRYYIDLHRELLDHPMELCADLTKIADIWAQIVTYPIVYLMARFNENYKFYLISYLFKFDLSEITPTFVEKICRLLIKIFALIDITGIGYSSALVKSFLFKENVKLVKDTDLAEIENDFRIHIDQNWKYDDVKQDIWDYYGDSLIYLNEYLYAQSHGKEFYLSDNATIEHIMPASGRNYDIIREDAGITDIEEFKKTVEMLGNKIVLEDKINIISSNGWFRTKKTKNIQSATGYRDSRYAIARDLVDYPGDEWGAKDINLCTERAANRIVDFIFSGHIQGD